jgi:hypothetical protein
MVDGVLERFMHLRALDEQSKDASRETVKDCLTEWLSASQILLRTQNNSMFISVLFAITAAFVSSLGDSEIPTFLHINPQIAMTTNHNPKT